MSHCHRLPNGMTGNHDPIMASNNGTDSSQSRGYIEYSERPETYIVPVVFAAIFLVGVTGNGGLVWIICRHKSMRSVPNTFILNLAIGDLLVLFIAVPFTSTIYTLDSWPYGELICKASEFVKDTSIGVSVFTLTALSANRYAATVRSVQSYVGGAKPKQVAAALVAIWTLSFALAMPGALFSHLLTIKIPPPAAGQWVLDENGTATHLRDVYVCYPFPLEFGQSYAKFIIAMRVVLYYGLPLVVIAVLHGAMARHLLRSAQPIAGQASVNNSASDAPPAQRALEPSELGSHQRQQIVQSQSRRNVVKMLLWLVALFAICFSPIHVFMLWFFFEPNAHQLYNDYWHALKIVGFVFAFTNSCVNPIALYFVSSAFRKHFNRLLFRSPPSAASAGVVGRLPAADSSLSSVRLQPSTAQQSRTPFGTRTSDASDSSDASATVRYQATPHEEPGAVPLRRLVQLHHGNSN